MYCSHRFDERRMILALAMINAIELMNKSPLLKAVNVTLGYRILDSCSDPSTSLRHIGDFMQWEKCNTESNTSACGQPVMAVIGAASSEVSIAIARQLTLQMIPQVSCWPSVATLTHIALTVIESSRTGLQWWLTNIKQQIPFMIITICIGQDIFKVRSHR